MYTFTFGKEELETIFKILQKTYDATPLVFDIMPYRGRLRNITKELGTVYLEVIKGKKLPTKGVHLFQKKLKDAAEIIKE